MGGVAARPRKGLNRRKPSTKLFGESTLLSIPGQPGATCDGVSRRELLRVGGAGLLGISLAQLLQLEALGAPAAAGMRPGFKTAKNFIFIFLQRGPSHLDICDPKPAAPDNVRRDLNTLPSN